MNITRESVIAEKYRLLALLDNATTEEEHDIINNALASIYEWLMFN